MTRSDVRAALEALRATLPQPQGEDEVTLAQARELLGITSADATEKLLTEAGWPMRVALLANGRKGRVWRLPA